MKKYRPTFISLFSGCGGFDLGFLSKDFECIGAYDNDQAVIDVYKRNIGSHIINHDLSVPQLPTDTKKVDVVISGSPCQGFSTVGLRKFDDPRNSLLFVGGQIAVKYKAKVFVAENVMGSVSGEHKKYWDELIDFLLGEGYQTQITICRANEIGLAQTRKRVILYAWKGSGEISLSYPNKRESVSLKEAISKINGAPNKEYFNLPESNDLLIAKKINQGQKLCDVRGGERSIHSWNIPEVFGECTDEEVEVLTAIQKLRRRVRKRKIGDADPVDLHVLEEYLSNSNVLSLLDGLKKKNYIVEKKSKQFDIKRSFNGKFRRLSLDAPSLTIDSHFGNPRYFLHPTENRGFSVREAARIQGFPDDFEFSGTLNQQFKMIGNAVPPPMAKEIAVNVLNLLNQ
ncbi:DNA cytosine methyltransferase [Reichenbachiella sp.]|uniref:DNA cytosine methyltransferase n=1 Tax=Reichenbachiella sp. TaxID=2184521 RepID=UPI003296ECE9